MTRPICYHVSPVIGGWQAQYDHDPSTSLFGTRAFAIEAALGAAETHWRMSGLATCVKIEDDLGAIVQDISFGVPNDHQ